MLGLIETYGQAQADNAASLIEALSALDTHSEEIAANLHDAKSRFDLNWAASALSKDTDFKSHGRLRSEFADASIEIALQAAWHLELKAQRIKPVPMKGLFVLGLGKLGGFDLNFSSDVDLIAYYDPEILPISANKGQKYVINKVLQRLTQILKPNHSPNFVWRVDWRLRPESSTGGLAITTDEATNFYFFRALPWHRLALMKARIVAGDMAIGEAFLKELTPFIWRQNLDFRALDELAHLKTRINLEHPGLQQERKQDVPITPDPKGFNVKLGSGGIREIEFIANAQQLIWGGKQYELRTTNTLDALAALAELGHISKTDSAALQENYIILRQLENAIQMQWNDQTHMVPDSDAVLNDIATILDVNWSVLRERLFTLRQQVNLAFSSLFQASEKEVSSTPSISALSEINQEIARTWLSGFDQHGVKRTKLPDFQPLGRSLLARVINSMAGSDEALPRIDRFLKTLSRSEQYFHLLQRNPELLDALITPLLHSPHMTLLLEQSPHIIDVFLNPQNAMKSNGTAPNIEFVFADEDYETRLERLRRFVNEYLFQYYHLFMQGEDDLATVQHNLTRLAETTIEAAIDIACHDLGAKNLPVTVLGLGKMGTHRMAPQSDLDLIFVFDDAVDSELASKVVRRLRTVITTPLREGIAYELDMRLRPSGRSGPPAVKLASLHDHHMNRAKTWEHIALAHSRIVAGDKALGAKVTAIRDEVLARPRERQQFLMDAMVMWSRIAEQRIRDTKPDVINAKLRTGGLMQAEYLDACFKLLGEDSGEFDLAIQFWSEIQIWERLLGLTGQPITNIPDRFKDAVLGPKPASFIKAVKANEKKANARMNTLFSGVELPSNYSESPIRWMN